MVPAGSLSELQLDADPLSLRALLLPHCTSIKYALKRGVGELLFTLCDEQRQGTDTQPTLSPLSAPVSHSLSLPLSPSA